MATKAMKRTRDEGTPLQHKKAKTAVNMTQQKLAETESVFNSREMGVLVKDTSAAATVVKAADEASQDVSDKYAYDNPLICNWCKKKRGSTRWTGGRVCHDCWSS